MPKPLFIAATGRDIGKTSISLGLIHLLSKKMERIAFIKPVAQRYVQISEDKIGDDALLIKETFGLEYDVKDMSPLIIEKGFTEKYINGQTGRGFVKKIRRAYENLAKESDLVIIEGTGHAGVGSIIKSSNADVAKLLGANVLLLCGGGIGRSIDEIALNKTFFEQKGCKVIGVIVNKILEQKYDKVSPFLKRYLKTAGIPLFALLPYRSLLSNPPLWLIAQQTKANILSGKEYLEKNIEKIIVGTMEPETMLELLRDIRQQTLLITSSDRIDLLLAVFTTYFKNIGNAHNLSGVLLSGKQKLPQSISDILASVNIPVLMVDEDIYSLASQIYSLRTKINSQDNKKITALKKLAEDYIDIESLYKILTSEEKTVKKGWWERIMNFFKGFGKNRV